MRLANETTASIDSIVRASPPRATDSSFAAVLRRAGEFEMRPIVIELYEQVA
jgi:hypothetical protein